MLLGDVFKLATFFQAGNDGLGIGFFFNQDMARLVFLAAVGSGELVVFGLEVGVSDRRNWPSISGVTGRPDLATCWASASRRVLGTALPLTMATFWAIAPVVPSVSKLARAVASKSCFFMIKSKSLGE